MKMLPAFGKVVALAIFVSACLPADALALFGRERSRLLKEADLTYEEAQAAGSEGRILDEIASLSDARALYGRLLEAHPGYRTAYADAQFKRCGAHLRIIAARIKSGEIAIPEPDAIMQGEGEGYVSPETLQAEPSVPGYRTPIPPLVDVEAMERKQAEVATTNTDGSSSNAATIQITTAVPPSTDYSKKMASPASEWPQTDEAVNEAPRSQSSIETADASMRIRIIHELIASGKASEAVLLLEDLIEKENERDSETMRLLLVQALLECRNYRRAENELAPLMRAQPPNPAARSFASAIALQKDNLAEAMYQMDRLLHDYPAYSDAYVNMAYLYYMMNPKTNREMAIICYRSALAFGSKRDPAFETALGIEIIK